MSRIIDFHTNQKTIFRVVGDNYFTSLSEVKIVYSRLNSEFILFEDYLMEGIKAMQSILEKAIVYSLQTLDLVGKESMGFLWNEYCNKLNIENQVSDDITAPFHLWSTSSIIGIDTWIYNIGEKIILEVSPTYRWHFDEPAGFDCITYEQFIKEYVPIDVLEIDNSTAKEWLEICKDILGNTTLY